VFTVSEFMREVIIRSSGVSSDRVSVLDNVVDTERFRPDPQIRERSGIVFVGRIAAEKGVATLIRAMPEVVRVLPNTALEIVGPDRSGDRQGRYLRMCRDLIRENGLEAHVRFSGEIENHAVPEIIRRHKVLAVPSLWNEPCGMAILEGLACGTPVVASRVGAVPGLIEDGVTGLLVKPGDPALWADALVRALRDARLSRTCSVRGPQFVARHHTWESISARLRTTYTRLLET
jgi:glycosyltransferase involved in cell wall biosynthesis